MRRIAPLVLAGLLAACSGGEEPASDATPETSTPPAPDQPEASPEPASTTSSDYSTLDIGSCSEIDRATEGESVTWRCNGLQGIPYWVKLGDGRYDIDVGAQAERDFATLGAFNDLGDTMEWRMDGGEPFAVIFRYRDVAMETPDRTVLAVEKIARNGQPGCRIAHVAGDTPAANERARNIADNEATAFQCGVDEPTFIGEAR